jgi:SAM-dependent methyltransferase
MKHTLIENGVEVKIDEPITANKPWFKSTKRVLDIVFPSDRGKYSILDLGCLDGGYAIEFAKMGFNSVGIEVRDINYQSCLLNKKQSGLKNVEFYKDDVWNSDKYGEFDAIYCGGLLYHLDDPRGFINMISKVTKKVLIIQTHFATERPLDPEFEESINWNLKEIRYENGLHGRWFWEYPMDISLKEKEMHNYAGWENPNTSLGWVRSFWITREWILHLLKESGFDVVLEQFDNIGDDIHHSMTEGYYWKSNRGTFIGIKTGISNEQINFVILGPGMPIMKK